MRIIRPIHAHHLGGSCASLFSVILRFRLQSYENNHKNPQQLRKKWLLRVHFLNFSKWRCLFCPFEGELLAQDAEVVGGDVDDGGYLLQWQFVEYAGAPAEQHQVALEGAEAVEV